MQKLVTSDVRLLPSTGVSSTVVVAARSVDVVLSSAAEDVPVVDADRSDGVASASAVTSETRRPALLKRVKTAALLTF